MKRETLVGLVLAFALLIAGCSAAAGPPTPSAPSPDLQATVQAGVQATVAAMAAAAPPPPTRK